MSGITIPLRIGLHSRYKLIRRKADDTIVEESAWSDNMILNNGLDYFGSVFGTAQLRQCHVGSGNTPPAAGNGSLEIFVAGTSDDTFVSSFVESTTARYTTITTRWRFAAGVAEGNISEVGIAISATDNIDSGAPLFSRALVVDGAGSPTTITVLADEILDVMWEYTKYAPAEDIAGIVSIDIDGTPTAHNYTIRPCNIISGGSSWSTSIHSRIDAVPPNSGNMSNFGSGAGNSTMGAPFTVLSGTAEAGTSMSASTYISGDYFIDTTLVFGLDVCNFVGGITALKFNNGVVGWMMEISPAIQKINTKSFSLTLRNVWANGAP